MKNLIRIPGRLFPSIMTMVACLCAPIAALAGTDIWDGGGGNDIFWRTAGNWQGNTVPLAGDDLIFTGSVGLVTSNNFTVGTSFNSITFATPAGAFVLEGRNVAVNAVTNGQAFTPQTFNLSLVTSNTMIMNLVDNGLLVVNKEIQGPGGILINGNGEVDLNYGATNQTTNIFAGTLEVDGGTVVPASDLSLGTTNDLASPQAGRLVLNGGSLEASGNLLINPNRGIALGPTSGSGWGGLTVDSGNTLTYAGVIANNGGTGGLYKAGYGTLALSGVNTYTGPTTNSTGTLLLNMGPSTASGGVINSSSSFVSGGGNAGLSDQNVARLLMAGGSEADSQNFASAFATLGLSVIEATNGSSGTVNLGLGNISHEPGGVMIFVTPEQSGGGHVNTTTANVNGILGGWALLSADTNGPVIFHEGSNGGQDIVLGTNFAAVDINGNIINYTGFSNVNAGAGTIVSQIAGSPQPPNINIDDSAGATAINLDTDGAGTLTDINAIKWFAIQGSTFSIGVSNTLRLGQYGGILRNGAVATAFFGGSNSVVQTGNGIIGDGSIGTLTAGGADNTPGEIVIAANYPSESSGTTIFECNITDNGNAPVSVVKVGPGSIKLDGGNTFSGGLYLVQGRVQQEAAEIQNTNADGTFKNSAGTGDVYVFPGCYLLGGTYTNHCVVAGLGDAHEHFGVFRGATVNGPVTLMGDTSLGCDTTFINGPISGPFSLSIGSPSRNGTMSLADSSDSWTGDTHIAADGGSRVNTLVSSNNEVIPNGFGYGNVIIEQTSSGRAIWNMNGFNETINGLSDSGADADGHDCMITNTSATTSILTLGDNDQSGSFFGLIASGNGSIAVTKIGAGIETFRNNETYTGNTTISNGVLQLTGSGAINNSPVVNVNGGTFDVSGVSYNIPTTQSVNVNGGTFKINSASSSGSGILNLTDGTLEISSASLVASYNGALTLAGTQNTIHIDNMPREGEWPHTFPLVTYTSLTGDPNTLVPQFPSPAYQGFISNDTTTSTIYVVITNGPITVSINWNGNVSSDWDFATANWLISGHGTNYLDGDLLTFPDSAANFNVNLTDFMNPAGVTLSNSLSHTYVFSGVGGITGTNPIVKDGNGTWILDNSGVNDFSGGLSIVNGTVQVGNNDANGSIGTGPVGDNGALIFDSTANQSVDTSISGTGSVTQEGAGSTLALNGANSFGGPLLATNGTIVQVNNSSALGSTNGNTVIASGSTLDVAAPGLGANALNLGAEQVIVSGNGTDGNGAIINSGVNSQQNALQQVMLTGDTSIGGANATGRFDIRGGSLGVTPAGSPWNLTKKGANFVSLANLIVDPSLGDIDVQGGTLELNGTLTSVGNTQSNLLVENGAALQLYSLTNQLNKKITMGSSISDATTLINANGNNTVVGPMTMNGFVAINTANSTTLTLNDAINGTAQIIKTGTNGTVVIAGTDNHNSGTTVNDGTYILNTINNNGGIANQLTENISLTAGFTTTLGGNGTNAAPVDIEDTLWPGVAGHPATFGAGDGVNTYNGDGSGALAFGDLGNTAKAIFSLNTDTTVGSGVNDLVTVNGDFDGGNAHVLINPLSPLNAGSTYTLVRYTGVMNLGFFSSVSVLPSLQPSRYAFHLDTTTPGLIQLDVTSGTGSLVWNNAQANGIWDLTNNFNWFNTLGGTNDYFAQQDSVTFDDSLAGPSNAVTIASAVAPGSITVDTTNIYSLAGQGKITGSAGLTKNGTGTVFLGGTGNDFTGATLLNAGTLAVNAANALGSSNNTVTVASGATVDVGGPLLRANAATVVGGTTVLVSGWGVNSNGAIINGGNLAQQNAIQNIMLLGDTAFGGPGAAQATNNPGRWDIRGGGPTLSTGGNAYNLFKVGGNQVSLVGVTVDTNLADINILGGEFGVETTTSPTLGNPTNTITVATAASFEFFNFAGPLNKNLVVNGGAMLLNSNRPNIWFNSGSYPSNTIVSPVIVTNGLVAIGGTGSGTFSNVISGPGSVLICGGVTLYAANTYSGDTIVSNNGDLFFVNNASIDSPNITLGGGGATVDVTGLASTTLTLASGQTLLGGGTVNGSLSSPSGTTVSLGTDSTVGSLTVTTNATLDGNTIVKLDAGNLTNDVLAANGNIAFSGTLTISTNLSGAFAGGQSFKLFNAATYTGTISSVTPATPGAGLIWDTSSLNVDGTLKVVSTVTPTPVITSIGLNGTTLTITATNGSNGGQYTLLESTNVALPLAQWTPVLTNNFDGNGDINLSTNIVNSADAQEFYILQVP